MKTPLIYLLSLAAILTVQGTETITWDTSGAVGVIDAATFATDASVMINPPPDGILHCSSITIPAGKTLSFAQNKRNTPIYLLSQGDVVIEGTIDVAGKPTTTPTVVGGKGGPGGWDGGRAKTTDMARGLGYGPGAADQNPLLSDIGLAGHSTNGSTGSSTYGTKLLVPLMGGSGSGGLNTSPNIAGGGGGGAILISSESRITHTGAVLASGGPGTATTLTTIATTSSNYHNSQGSGGAIRLRAPVVVGTGTLDASPRGRIRVDSLDRGSLSFTRTGTHVYSLGANMITIPVSVPKLEIIELAGQTVDPDAVGSVSIVLPEGSAASQTVKVRAANFPATAALEVVVTPEEGTRTRVPLDILDAGAAGAVGEATISLSIGVLTTVEVWTR